MTPADWPLFSDALFLHEHPSWTWQALQDTPDEVLELIGRMDQAVIKRSD